MAKVTSSKKIFVVVGILIFFVVVVGGIFAYLQYQKQETLRKNPTLAAQTDAQTLVKRVGELMLLPQAEQPTIATVSDITKLKGQPFFKNAKNGFKVIMYPKAKKAILYDPLNNKIIDVAPINTTPSQAAMRPTPAAVSVVLYNGSLRVGLTTLIEGQLKEKFPQITVTQKQNASKQDYPKTIVVDLSGKNKEFAQQVATQLGGEVGSLPASEEAPKDASILVILGEK